MFNLFDSCYVFWWQLNLVGEDDVWNMA